MLSSFVVHGRVNFYDPLNRFSVDLETRIPLLRLIRPDNMAYSDCAGIAPNTFIVGRVYIVLSL